MSVTFQKTHSILPMFKERKINKQSNQDDLAWLVNMTPGPTSTVQKLILSQVVNKSIIGNNFYFYQHCFVDKSSLIY